MAEDVVAMLARDLRVDRGELSFLDDVDAPALRRLQEAVAAAHAQQEQALAEAFEGTIGLVPRPLRSRVRKMLMGG